MSQPDTYEIYAIKYATRVGVRHTMFQPVVEDPDAKMRMDYFTWLLVSPNRVIGVDAGFTAETAVRMKREFIASPLETTKRLGYDPNDIKTLILTHLHYDHAGNADGFPNAQIVLQQEEMAFWTGPYAGRGSNAEQKDFAYLVGANLGNRIRWVNGDADVAPGVSVHLVRGHTPGMQVVRVNTARGIVILASDSSHYYENIERDRPYRTVHTVPLAYAAFDRVNELAGDDKCIVPGHDPLVMERFERVPGELHDLVVKIA